MADEFSAELAEGVAYVAGHDEESRPVVVIVSPFPPFIFTVSSYSTRFGQKSKSK